MADEQKWTVSELDAMHTLVGLGPEWLASDERADLLREVTVPGEVIEEKPDEFECERCHGVFTKAWSDDEAAAEAEANFGDIPAEEKALICDACWQEFKAWFKATTGEDLIG